MAWYENRVVEFEESAVMEAQTLSMDAARQLANRLGLDLQTTKDGSVVTVPNYIATGSSSAVEDFVEFWTQSAKADPKLEAERRKRYQHYDMMDRVMGECMIMLDTYCDESLSTGFISNPVEILISDKGAEERVQQIFSRNKILERLRSIVRNLIKWGDLGFQIRFGTQLDPFQVAEDTYKWNKKIPVKPEVYEPENMSIDIHTPDVWEIRMDKETKLPTGYRYVGENIPYAKKDTVVSPLSFVQISMPDESMFPYGRSILDPLRTIFDQLSTIEALLAISRASRVERLIVKIPTTTDNPTAAMTQMQTMRGQWKNMIFTDSGSGRRTYPRTPSLQDILFIPAMEGFEISPLKPSIDIANIADVEFFRDKAITLTGLPKGYFLADQVTDRGGALASQDLKFARRIIPIQDVLCQGITKLVMVVCAYLGYDIRNLRITTKVKRPIQIADPILASYVNISNTARMLLENYNVFSPRDQTGMVLNPATQKQFAAMLRALGMNDDLVKIMTIDQGTPVQVPAFTYDPQNSSHALVDAATYDSQRILTTGGPHVRQGFQALYESVGRR